MPPPVTTGGRRWWLVVVVFEDVVSLAPGNRQEERGGRQSFTKSNGVNSPSRLWDYHPCRGLIKAVKKDHSHVCDADPLKESSGHRVLRIRIHWPESFGTHEI